MSDDGSYAARHERALDVYRTLRGDASLDLAQAARGIEAVMGAIGSFSIDHVLGDIWSRPELARRDRSLVSVTALVCLAAEQELRTHLSGALNHGVEREELEELMLHVSAYAGFPRAFDGMRVALALFQDSARSWEDLLLAFPHLAIPLRLQDAWLHALSQAQ